MAKKLTDVQLGILAARTAISKKSTWTQDAIAKNENDDWVHPDAPSAVCWCAVGAVDAFVPVKLQNKVLLALNNAVDDLYPKAGSIVAINDDKGHKAILKVFDHAFACSGE